jgi:UDP-GlcNAc:undecaprenyl-phosphate GlcNAc-1-phosphate transferase
MDNAHFYALSCAMTAFFIHFLHSWAIRFRLVDIPSDRKKHIGEIPLTGGLAMFLAVALTLLLQGVLAGGYFAFFLAITLLVVTGMFDDLHDLSARVRFLIQAAAALLMVYAGKVVIADLGNLLGAGSLYLNGWSVPFTIFCVIGVVNAVNMLDGVDGLAGGVVLVVLLAFGFAALLGGHSTQATLLFILASAVAGFALFNMRSPWRSRAVVFMGDSGSTMLGFAVAWFAIDLTQQPVKPFAPITAVWILALPILDTVSLMLRRILKGRSPFEPDRDHLHHIFLRAGFSVSQTVILIVLASVVLAFLAIGAWYVGIPDYIMFYGFLLVFLAYFFGLSHAWKLMRVIRQVRDVATNDHSIL